MSVTLNRSIDRFFEYLPTTPTPVVWLGRVVVVLDEWDDYLHHIPNFPVQDRLDSWGEIINREISAIPTFQSWLEDNQGDEWATQMAAYLALLPAKTADDFISSLFSTIKAIVYGLVHPLNGAVMGGKFLVGIAHSFVEIDRWHRSGARLLGSSIENALSTKGPISPIKFALGGALLIAGLTFEPLSLALENSDGGQAAQELFLMRASEVPGAFTGGLVSSKISRSTSGPFKQLVHKLFQRVYANLEQIYTSR